MGSRPAKRRPTGGVESLRAIPWIFAWTQNRLMLPAWLECRYGAAEGGRRWQTERAGGCMYRDWPFFSTRLGMLEMVFAKADLWLAEYYDQRLVKTKLWPLGNEDSRNLQEEDIKVVLAIANDSHLMADLPWIAESIQLRRYLHRPAERIAGRVAAPLPPGRRRGPGTESSRVEQALMVTIAGIAAGMRNTG
ncbi:phosphoenolpyruvate carboxylase [Escherichia coli]|nr:phosphoenolpyruvate carboxylase [Escherichia coli]